MCAAAPALPSTLGATRSCGVRLRPALPSAVRAATIVDVVGSAALMTLSPKGGVSLYINTNYVSKLPLKGVALIEAQVRRRC